MMDEKDLEQLREVHAGFALIGLLMKGHTPQDTPKMAYELADAMIEARSESAGIASVKKRHYAKKEKEQHESN